MADRPETLSTRLIDVFTVVAGIVVALGALVLSVLVPSALGFPPPVTTLIFLLVLIAVTAAAGLRQYPLTAFGTRTDVDYAVTTEGRCDECGSRIETGERRRYKHQVVAFGIPLHTLDWGLNSYCYDCREATGGEHGFETEPEREYERELA